MTLRAAMRFFLAGFLSLLPFCGSMAAQAGAARSANRGADLELVVVLSRHGVRAPMAAPEQYDAYSAAPWPKWDVPPSYLTAHGYQLMKLLGAWDRMELSAEGLLAASGCGDAAHVTIVADTDQRTRESGNALAEGMFPGCGVPVHSLHDGAIDPLFRPIESGLVHPDYALAAAAVEGRIGGNPNNLTETYRAKLGMLDRVLAGCGHEPVNRKRISIFDVPAGLGPGYGNHPVALRGPVSTAATLAENLLLEYTQGMSDADTGWGCLDADTLRTVMQLDSANWDYGMRTPTIARLYASNLLDHILKTMEQSASGKPVAGALGKSDDWLVVLVGHDTNIVTVAGVLGIDWIEDGRADDTPPGGALVFELWRPRGGGEPYVRVKYRAQTLEQMRKAETLTRTNPPAEAPIFVPGCSQADLACTWAGFSAAVKQAIDPAYVNAQR